MTNSLQSYLTPQAWQELQIERLIRRASSKRARLKLPALLGWQETVLSEARRFNVVCVGRRAGKTALGIYLCADPTMLRYPVGWFSPSYKLMLEVWRQVALLFAPVIARQNVVERRFEFEFGGVLEFWSLDNPQAGRGRKYRRVVVDEAAFVPLLLDAWNYAIRPTLADLQGDAWILSTPKGRNGFWKMWQYGQDASNRQWASWQFPSEVNPLIPSDELLEMRRSQPERVVAQELDAQFLDDAGGVFRRVIDAATVSPQDSGIHGHEYIFGVDWGRSNDFTAIAVLDLTTSELCHLDRFNQIDYQVQLGRLDALAARFRPRAIVAEANSMGQPLIEQLQRGNLPVVPFTTTSASKSVAIDALALAFERGAIRIIPDPVLIGELQAYEAERLPSGMMRYGAPAGIHDDTVMALALAWGRGSIDDRIQVGHYVERSYDQRTNSRQRQLAR